ncbi:MAG: 1-deoxy-D-xylulose-5-phosphate reductoisomerase [Tannerellaceae bacterium]|jgi:1-deoxy-D-xylulose-5-phosphate reductoisomerase|nr:1-deoxy-D-xylulose-5-phosphate reductoisomerase [Tannerellaceae bacterium]
MKRQLAILGSTGSIGVQALEVVSAHPELFEVYALTANENVDLLIEQVHSFSPEAVVIANEAKYHQLKEGLKDLPVKVWAGEEAMEQVASCQAVDIVLTALVGYAGLKPTLSAIRAGKAIALANKETLVVAGELVTALASAHHSALLPVDSEHSAIFQCLSGQVQNPVEKLILTASGGPFRTTSLQELESVTRSQALNHPNWTMGAKITIDSASMINKGFEMIEAHWLFHIAPDKIDIVVHPQSVIHSMVQFEDGAVIAQLGIPDMKLPIAYALSYPYRLRNGSPRLDFCRYGAFTFESPDYVRFPNLSFAFEAIGKGGNMPCILNAANEVAVSAFLSEKIPFLGMSKVIEQTMERATFVSSPVYEDYVATDAEARRLASELC